MLLEMNAPQYTNINKLTCPKLESHYPHPPRPSDPVLPVPFPFASTIPEQALPFPQPLL